MKINNPTTVNTDLYMLHLACTTNMVVSDLAFAERLANIINSAGEISENNSVICGGMMVALTRRQQLFGSTLSAELIRNY